MIACENVGNRDEISPDGKIFFLRKKKSWKATIWNRINRLKSMLRTYKNQQKQINPQFEKKNRENLLMLHT